MVSTEPGAAQSLVSQWEVGRVTDPKLKTVLALQDALQVPVEWLVTGHGPSDLPAAALEAGGKVDIPRLERALSLALALDLGGSAETAEAAVLLYEFLKTSSSVNDEMLLAVARLGRSAR